MIISSLSSAFSGPGSLPPLPSMVVFVRIILKLNGFLGLLLLCALAVHGQHLLHALTGLPVPTKRFNGHSVELVSLDEMMVV